MQIEGTYSANEKNWANRANTLPQQPRTDAAQPSFASRLARHIFEILDAGFMAERTQRASRSSRLALLSVR